MSHYQQPGQQGHYDAGSVPQQGHQFPYQATPGQNYPNSPGSYGQHTPGQVQPQPANYPPQYHDVKMDPHQHPQQPANAYHQQAQMVHEKPVAVAHASEEHKPAAKLGNAWSFGFWDCCSPFGLSCFACWCPCLLFGKTYDREHGKADSSGCNMMCCAWYCAASLGFNSCLQCIIRGQMREKYNIDSNTFNDFCGACCCPCCALVQEEKESLVRNTGIDPTTKVAYQPVQAMGYHA